jgi:outer membrane protein, heavy metal efflux system
MHMRTRLCACMSIFAISGCAIHKQIAASGPSAPALVASHAERLEMRSLDDPDLRGWMTSSAGVTPHTWPLAEWSLSNLALAAYYFNPDLDLARANAAVANAAISTAAMKPNPTVSVGPGYETAPESPYMLGLNFSLPIETAGKRGYRIAEATHLSDATREQIALTAWNVRGRVRSALVDLLFAEKSVNLLGQQEAWQAKYTEMLESRFRAGEIPLPDLSTTRIDLANLRQSLRQVEGQEKSARAMLAAAIGVPLAALDGKRLVWDEAETLPPPQDFSISSVRAIAVRNRLDVQQAIARYEAAQSRLQLELARRYPDIDIGPGYAFEEGSHLISLQLGAALPIRNRNEGPITEAEAQRKGAGTQLLATQSAVIAETDRGFAQYDSAFAAWKAAAQSAMEAQQQRQNMHRWLEAGEADRLQAVSAEIQAAVAERARIDALHQAQTALGLLEDAVERPLTGEALPSFPEQAPNRREVQ